MRVRVLISVARLYSPVIRRWVTPDPMSEDYYGISPYAYCAGDLVNFVGSPSLIKKADD